MILGAEGDLQVDSSIPNTEKWEESTFATPTCDTTSRTVLGRKLADRAGFLIVKVDGLKRSSRSQVEGHGSI
jgi:hypothetical protein